MYIERTQYTFTTCGGSFRPKALIKVLPSLHPDSDLPLPLSSQNEPFYFRALCFPAYVMSLRPSLTPNIHSWIFLWVLWYFSCNNYVMKYLLLFNKIEGLFLIKMSFAIIFIRMLCDCSQNWKEKEKTTSWEAISMFRYNHHFLSAVNCSASWRNAANLIVTSWAWILVC